MKYFTKSVKARKQGNSLMVTLPKELGVNEGDEFNIIKLEDGSISIIPKVEDYFKVAEEGEFYDKDEAWNYSPKGREWE